MATVTQNYKIAAQAYRPNAALKCVVQDGNRFYRIVDGDEVLADELSPLMAWREAECYLCNRAAEIAAARREAV